MSHSDQLVPHGNILRYAFHERLTHWFAGFSYVYLLLTGLAFYSPHLFWIAQVLGGGPTSRFWHPFSGLAFFAVALWMHSIWGRDMEITAEDKQWLDHTKEYATGHDEGVPPAIAYLVGLDIRPVPPAAAQSLEQRDGIGVAIGLCLDHV